MWLLTSFLGQNRTQFSISFFIFALLFLLFDLEILLVYPYLVSAYVNEAYGLSVLMIFLGALTIGFVFELGKKALTIDSRQTGHGSKKERALLVSQSNSTISYNNHISNMVSVKSSVLPIKPFFRSSLSTSVYAHTTHMDKGTTVETVTLFSNKRNSFKLSSTLNNSQKRGLCTTKPLHVPRPSIDERFQDERRAFHHMRGLSRIFRTMNGEDNSPVAELRDESYDRMQSLSANILRNGQLRPIRSPYNRIWDGFDVNNKPNDFCPSRSVDTEENTAGIFSAPSHTIRLRKLIKPHNGEEGPGVTYMGTPKDNPNENRDMRGNIVGPSLEPVQPTVGSVVTDSFVPLDKQIKRQLDFDPGVREVRQVKRRVDAAFIEEANKTYSDKRSYMSLHSNTGANTPAGTNFTDQVTTLSLSPIFVLTVDLGEANPLLRLTAYAMVHIYKYRHSMPFCLHPYITWLDTVWTSIIKSWFSYIAIVSCKLKMLWGRVYVIYAITAVLNKSAITLGRKLLIRYKRAVLKKNILHHLSHNEVLLLNLTKPRNKDDVG